MNVSKISHDSIKRYRADSNFNQTLRTPLSSSRSVIKKCASPKPDEKMKLMWKGGSKSDRNISATFNVHK